MIEGQADFSVLFFTVLIGVLSLFVVAFFWSRVFKNTHTYPVAWLQRSPPQRLSGVWQDAN
jgi:cell shape-determining protein MreC